MEKLTRVSINIFPIVMLFMILLNNHGKMERTKSSHYFDGLTLFTMLDMIVEVAENPIVWMCGETPDLRLWVIHVARLMVCAGIASAWLCYVTYRLYENRVCRYTRYISWGAHTVFAAMQWQYCLYPGKNLVLSRRVGFSANLLLCGTDREYFPDSAEYRNCGVPVFSQ